MGSISIFHWLVLLLVVGVPIILLVALLNKRK